MGRGGAIPQAENFLFNGSGVEPGASGMLGECCATEKHLQHRERTVHTR